MDSIRARFARAGLVRSRDHRIFGGVVAGLGRHFDLEPAASRWLFVIALLVVPGSQALVYPVLWFCMPLEGDYVVDTAAAQAA